MKTQKTPVAPLSRRFTWSPCRPAAARPATLRKTPSGCC